MTDDPREQQGEHPRQPPPEEGQRERERDGGPNRGVPKPGGTEDERTG